MVNWHPLGFIWHPLKGPGYMCCLFLYHLLKLISILSTIPLLQRSFGPQNHETCRLWTLTMKVVGSHGCTCLFIEFTSFSIQPKHAHQTFPNTNFHQKDSWILQKTQVDPVLDLTICKCLTYGHLVQDLENLISIKGAEGSVPHCGGGRASASGRVGPKTILPKGTPDQIRDTSQWGFFLFGSRETFFGNGCDGTNGWFFSFGGVVLMELMGDAEFVYVYIRFTTITRWWQLKYFLIFTPKIGEDDPFWREYISNGLVQPPTR